LNQVLHKEHLEAALHMGDRERQVELPDDARIALMTPPRERTEAHLSSLAAALASKPLFTRMPPHVRRQALQFVTLQRFEAHVRALPPPATASLPLAPPLRAK
jgi:hypothetical protein